MDKPQMTFWFEFASTYSYLSAMRVQEAADNAGVVVLWQPFLLGPVFGAQGWTTSPFNVYPRKGAYMWRDMARLAAERGLEFRQPEVFPQNGILAARVTLALRAAGHAVAPFVCAVYTRQFVRGQVISEPDIVTAALSDAGFGAEWLDAARDPDIKQALFDSGTEADRLQLFGAPSFSVGDEIFWGDDRLEHALRFAQS
jgi:2-hydroxychromene-2-carboxylate isomerase